MIFCRSESNFHVHFLIIFRKALEKIFLFHLSTIESNFHVDFRVVIKKM